MIAFKEFKFVQKLIVHNVDTIFTISELDDTAVVVPNGHVVADDKGLELLDQAAL